MRPATDGTGIQLGPRVVRDLRIYIYLLQRDGKCTVRVKQKPTWQNAKCRGLILKGFVCGECKEGEVTGGGKNILSLFVISVQPVTL